MKRNLVRWADVEVAEKHKGTVVLPLLSVEACESVSSLIGYRPVSQSVAVSQSITRPVSPSVVRASV